MKISKKIVSLLLLSILAVPSMSFANDATNTDDVAEPIQADELISTLESAGIKSINSNARSVVSDSSIDKMNVEENETVLLHNNGKPLTTDIFEEKQGNNLFAVSISNKNGVKTPTYYISNSEVLMDNTVEGIVEDTSSNVDSRSVQPRSTISRDYKWDFYRTLATGKKQQQGSLYTEVWFERKTTSASISGVKSSVWDVTSRSEVKARSSERINNTFVRLDVGSGSQKLHDFAPETSSQSSFTASLDQIVQPKSWTITAGGYTTSSLSPGVGSRYGRWQFKARPGTQHSWVVKPGVRASNSAGNFYLKYSQTMDLNFSDHGTGVVGISVPDR